MATQETIRDVPPDRVDALVSRYMQLGARVQTFPQSNGLVTVVATFAGAAHSTPANPAMARGPVVIRILILPFCCAPFSPWRAMTVHQ